MTIFTMGMSMKAVIKGGNFKVKENLLGEMEWSMKELSKMDFDTEEEFGKKKKNQTHHQEKSDVPLMRGNIKMTRKKDLGCIHGLLVTTTKEIS